MAVYLDLTNGPDNITFFPGQVMGRSVRGLAGNDNITGSTDRDDINGNQGDDTIYGGAGNDFLRGGQGNDVINGNQGNDIVYGNQGNDTVVGGQGDDLIFGGQGNDLVYGGQGNDTLYGDLGQDFLQGDAGNDVFVLRTDTAVSDPSAADVVLDFGNGDDLIGLTGGITANNLTFAQGGDTNGFTPFDTLIRLGSNGNYLGVVLNVTATQLAGKFVTISS